MRFAMGAGGTGGHIVPALALAKELSMQGHECIFIGNAHSMEERMAMQAGIPFHRIKVQKLYRSFKPDNLLFPIHLISSIFHSIRILKEGKIDGVITTGGFVAGPVAIAAILLKLPCFLHESNSYPGLTTRHLAKRLSRLYISFEDARKYLPGVKAFNYGIPIQKKEHKRPDLGLYGLDESRPCLLITGGSQGSLAINSAISTILDILITDGWQILWQTGGTTYRKFHAKHHATQGVHLFDFSPDLASMMLRADLAITRAGAMTIAELESAALPAVLIPLPTAAENHQYYNALAQKQKGVAELIPQKDLSPQNLLSTIKTMDREAMRSRLLALPVNSAAEMIVKDILALY